MRRIRYPWSRLCGACALRVSPREVRSASQNRGNPGIFSSQAFEAVKQGLRPAKVHEKPMEADRPVVIFSFDGTGERASLRVALDAGVVGADVIHSRRIHYVAPRGLLDVRTARTMTLFTAHVPLRHLLGLNVVINRMTAVASRPGRPLHIVGRIERGPPIGSVCDKV